MSPRARHFAALAAVLCAPALAHADAPPVTKRSGRPVRWEPRALEVCLTNDAKAIPGMARHVRTAIAVWKTAPAFPTMFVVDKRSCDILVHASNLPALFATRYAMRHIPPVLAITEYLEGEGRRFERAFITVNTHSGARLGDATNDPRALDLPSLLAHELGHAVGLGHESNDRRSVMWALLARGKVRRAPLPCDLRSLDALYAPDAEPPAPRLEAVEAEEDPPPAAETPTDWFLAPRVPSRDAP